MFNIRKFIGDVGLPRIAYLQKCITAAAMSATVIFGSLAVGAELILAGSAGHTTTIENEMYDHGHLVIGNTALELTQAIVSALLFETYQGEEQELSLELLSLEYGYVTEPGVDYELDYVPAGGMPQRVMFLTFDDGPTRLVTPLILDILAERGIYATFFVIGQNVRANPDIMRRIVDEGHTVGIHSDTHDYSQIYASLEAFINDFRVTQALIAEFTGYTPKIYRFPGGSVTRFNERVRREAIEFLEYNGYTYFDWNASIDDSIGGNRTPSQLLSRGLETVSGDHVIMLAHDTQPATAVMMGEMIDILAEDFIFDVITSETEPIQMQR